MNYRHAFHAGNFADLLKHAVLTALMAEMTRAGGPVTVIDTHAGAGGYDLAGEAARKTGEGAAGIGVLLTDAAAPAAFDALKAAVRRLGPDRYPGSPELIAAALRPSDALIACEVRQDDFAVLAGMLRRYRGAVAVREDGWEVAVRRTPAPPARAVVLIDPPYELGDDARSAAAAARAVLARNGAAIVAVWAPIKDLASFDAFLGALETAAGGRPVLVAEVRLRPLDDPTRLNGCAMIVIGAPAVIEAPAAAAANWIATVLGEQNPVGRANFVGS
jgi:23S rRNA (adenine2030-N6)-methyltransferase